MWGRVPPKLRRGPQSGWPGLGGGGKGVWQEEESTSLECPLSGRVRKAGSLGETQNPRRLWGQREGWSPGEQGASPQRGIGPRSKV